MTRSLVFAMVLLTACRPAPAAPPTVLPTATTRPVSTNTAQPSPAHEGSECCAPAVSPTALRPSPTSTPRPTATPAETDVPAPTATVDPVACVDLDSAWGTADWVTALQVLDRLQTVGLTCGDASLNSKRYAALVSYAVALENAGNHEAAVIQYRAALAVNGRGAEALEALGRLEALPSPTSPPCDPGELAPYVPSDQSFLSAAGNRLVIDGSTFVVRGVNYYPRHAPWDRFLTDGNLGEITEELDLIASAGFNTLRIFLWYDPLFTCAPESATPDPSTFARLDLFIALASQHNLRLVVTLNDLPDLLFRPLYTDYARYDAQTTFIVNRYRDEPAILAWDLRNEGDIDYGLHPSFPKRFEPDTVLDWLAHTAEIVRASDSRHLLTAGWWSGSLATAEVVDIVSFHHWTSPIELAGQLAWLKNRSSQPILVEEVGYSSAGNRGEAGQARALKEAITIVEQYGTAGWLIWTAFDFVPPEGQPPTLEHGFGLWHTDLSPKPALEDLPLQVAP